MKRSMGTLYRSGLLAAFLAAMAIGVAGCGSEKGTTEEEKQPAEETSSDEESTVEETTAAEQEPAQELTSATEILEKMADTYRKTPTYADKAQIRLLATSGDQKIDDTRNIVVALERPNKLRLDVFKTAEADDGDSFRAVVVCDGERFHSYLSVLEDQVVDREAPSEINLNSVFVDQVLGEMMMRSVGQLPPQLALLLSDTALKDLTRGAEEPTLEESGEIEGRACFRVKMMSPGGPATYWIDKQSFALRRMVLPTNDLRQNLPLPAPIESISLVIDFHGASLGKKPDANAFRFEAPEGVEQLKFFVLPSPPQLLGKKVPQFKLYDLDGNEITPESLAGKIAVMDFWATWCPPCKEGMPHFQEVYEKYRDNDKIQFLAVSVDDPKMENEKVAETLVDWGVEVPPARDMESNAGIGLRFDGIPTMIVIDANGVVQRAHSGLDRELNVNLPQMLDKLLVGEDVYQEALDEYLEQRKKNEERMEAALKAADLAPGSTVEDHAIPQAQVAPQSAPKNFKLMPVPEFKCEELNQPGNILPVTAADGKTTLLVVDAWKSVAEVGLDGKLIAKHDLDIDAMETVSLIRTAVDGEGKRYFAAMASAQQRFHVFDDQWKLLFSFPEDALENKHAGIADVQLADADGDGKIEAYVGYWGLVGIQAVSLEGKRLWSNRSVNNVLKITVGEPDQQNQRKLYCINNNGSLEVLSAENKSLGKVTVENRLLQWATNADLGGDGKLKWCGMSGTRPGENVVVGFDLGGNELWSKKLADGVPRTMVEPIIAGNFSGAEDGQWILTGPDGSVNVVTAAGEAVDQFNFGALINGLATATVDGRPMLLISSAEGLQAWFVER